eukprot:9422424-Ditylum_brightwellii.AAC.3
MDDAHQKTLLQRPLHGSWFRQQAEVPQADMDQSNLWLARDDLRGETEALICAAQEQVLSTNYVRNMTYKQPVSKLCCHCQQENETATHPVGGCKKFLKSKIMNRHNNMARYIHYCLFKGRKHPVLAR